MSVVFSACAVLENISAGVRNYLLLILCVCLGKCECECVYKFWYGRVYDYG